MAFCWRSYIFTKQTSSVLVGLCVGIALALILTPLVEEECIFQLQQSATLKSKHIFYSSNSENFEPKLAKPKAKQKTHKILRPRYYASELGIRQKLFVAVLSSKHRIQETGFAINKTLAHHVNKLMFFVEDMGDQKLPKELPHIIFKDPHTLLKPFHMLKYISEHFINDYDFYFIMEDTTYVRGMRLMEFVEHISISQQVYSGITLEDSGVYCKLGPGILISNSVMNAITSNLDWCMRNAYSEQLEVNLGRCILHNTNVGCKRNIQGQHFESLYVESNTTIHKLKNLISDKENILKTLSVYPIWSPDHMYYMQYWFAWKEIENIQKKTEDLKEDIKHHLPENEPELSWPIGLLPSYKPKDRFDVLSWEYFTEMEIYMDKELNVATPLIGVNLLDIKDILNSTCNYLDRKYSAKYRCKSLLNGYRRFDPTRGMEYIVDFEVQNTETGILERKRFEGLRPLSKPELVPIPYVTENTRIIMILPIFPEEVTRIDDFLKEYVKTGMEAQDNSALVLVLLYHPDSPGKGDSNDIYGNLKLQVTKYSRKYQGGITRISWVSIKTAGNIPSIFGIMDIISKKFPQNTLYLLCALGMELRTDYLNRVRMNTIEGWQVFFPMPFNSYHPGFYQKSENNEKIEINRHTGRIDEHEFNHASFYGSDYLTGRKLIELEIPIVRIDRDLHSAKHRNVKKTLIEMFLSIKTLHILRAPEPSLRVKYFSKDCPTSLPPLSYKQCENSRINRLGSKSQLALLLMEQEKRNSDEGGEEADVPQMAEEGEIGDEMDKKENDREAENKEYEDNVNEDVDKGGEDAKDKYDDIGNIAVPNL